VSNDPVEKVLRSFREELARGVSSRAEFERLKGAYLGREKGLVPQLLSTLKTLPASERAAFGASANAAKNEVEAALAELAGEIQRREAASRDRAAAVDVTLPGRRGHAGGLHPLTVVRRRIEEIFLRMGYSIADGPEVESDFHNFEALNFPPEHPARDTQDTLLLDRPARSPLLLRTHTSPVQIRTMMAKKPPIRVIIPGRTYRSDSDQTHTPMFHQVEGLVIDKGSHLGHLKWILQEFCKAFFEVDQVKMRFRPSFFPFTEPSLEVDIQCKRDKGEVRFGEGEDWMEILGCGMVHPNVLRNCGLDPDEYQGFAWGMGIDRIAMLKYGMPDLRAFFEADVRWLSHYGFRPLDFPTLAGGLS
jgi:phenylalanyl-tRNA synthetase alpha chain